MIFLTRLTTSYKIPTQIFLRAVFFYSVEKILKFSRKREILDLRGICLLFGVKSPVNVNHRS